MLAAVREYGYDGLELRLLGGEPIDVLSLDAGTRRAVGTALARAAVPLVCLDTSIELAQPFDRELPAALELACEWGAPAVRVFGGAWESSTDIARRLEPVLGRAEELEVTVALETHDSFASAVLVGELLQRRRQHVVRSGLGRPSSVPGRRGAGRRPPRARRCASSSCM